MPKIKHLESGNFILLAGPCVIEDAESPFSIAERIQNICDNLQIPFIFKASYRKANRSKSDSFKGIGDIKALEILREIGDNFMLPIVTDIHSAQEAELAAPYVDVLQIPAFLCRQSDILIAAAKTQKVVNIKKGQFVSPEIMKFAAEKVKENGNEKIMLTERGSMFGYYDLVVDFRNISEMQNYGFPVIYDVTHSLQQPNSGAGVSGGKPWLIDSLASAGIAAGANGVFIETHPNPAQAKSDGANMLDLSLLEPLLEKLVRIRKAIQS
ncbi:MAG: 3-deoxy-8-phosphooctulonate synthase [Bacteroidota bacterium]